MHISWAPVILMCQGIFLLLASNKTFMRVNADSVQHRRTLQTTPHQLRILKVDETPDWKTLPLFVWLCEFWVCWSFTVKEVISHHAALVAASAARLLMLLGHACRVRPQIFLMALRLWDTLLVCLAQWPCSTRGPVRAKRAWETQSAGARYKTLYRPCADAGLGRIRTGGFGLWVNWANSCD